MQIHCDWCWARPRIFPGSQLPTAVPTAASVSSKGGKPGLLHNGCPLCVILYRAPGGFFTGLEKARQKKKKSPKLIHTPFPSPFSSFPQQEWSFSVFNRGEVILELQHIPLSYTNCVFWLCPNHITPPFSPSFFLNIPRLLKTLNWQLGNGEQRKLKGIFGTPDYAEGT